MVEGFDARVEQELRMIAPAGSKIEVVRAYDAMLDAWRGARKFVQSRKVGEVAVSRAEYDECGH